MYSFILGIDISKLTLDAVLMMDGNKETATHTKLNNDKEDIATFFKSLSKMPGFSLDKCLICIEATGVYMYPLLTFAAQNDAHVWMESGTQIKKSMGIQRGKNDKVDAQRIVSPQLTPSFNTSIDLRPLSKIKYTHDKGN
jgi:transposase